MHERPLDKDALPSSHKQGKYSNIFLSLNVFVWNSATLNITIGGFILPGTLGKSGLQPGLLPWFSVQKIFGKCLSRVKREKHLPQTRFH